MPWQPGKRMLSAMTPTIVLDRSGHVLLVTGARGGPRIITAVFQVISNVIDHGMDVGTAVHAPRIHHQHLPDASFETDGLSA
jgi:gamma-glutamyltranspeptidase / glutathione hydrolase